MFEWLYRRIADGIIRNLDISKLDFSKTDFSKVQSPEFDLKSMFNKLVDDSEVQKTITEMGDALFERYKVKVLGTIGGLQKGINAMGGDVIPDVFDKQGHINLKKGLSWFLSNMASGQSQNQPQTSNTKNPYS